MATVVKMSNIWLVNSIRSMVKSWCHSLPKTNEHRRWLKRHAGRHRLDPETTFSNDRKHDVSHTVQDMSKMWQAILKHKVKPTIILCRIGNGYRIVQGHHLVASALANGERSLSATLVQNYF